MFRKQSSLAVVLVFVLAIGAVGQSQAQSRQTPPSTVTAAISGGDTVRVTSPGEIAQIQLEVYGVNGEVIFDSGLRSGNVIDWKAANAFGAIGQGPVLVVVTIRDLQNKASQKYGSLTLDAGQLTLKPEVTALQKQVLNNRQQGQNLESGPDLEMLAIVTSSNSRSLVVTTHNGQEGQVTSTSGPLTLGTGDALTGQDNAVVRVMPDGRVGIGVQNPEATLDVAGEIRARGGIRFDDGTVLTTASTGTASINKSKDAAVNVMGVSPSAAGSGTANKIAKWTDNAGTLGDSSVTELNGNVGIGTTTPGALLNIAANDGVGAPIRFTQSGTATRRNWQIGNQINVNNAFEFTPSTTIGGNTFSSPVLTLLGDGNVGVGTSAPTQKLEVAGNLKVSGAGNGLMFPDGSVLTSANPGGGSPSGSAVTTAINDPATVGTINDNRLSPNVARLTGQNYFQGQNTFNGLSMNGTNIVNLANPVSATDAVNKSYVDGGFVKFVPGAEQLSVGDANGTAPMINLRGGSTCCSGPGGHTPAWFKVFQNGSFVATGNLGIGVSPMQGKGYRTSWDSYKGAFRSGYADNEWDDANVGFFSWAGGSNSTAIGLYALAFGDTNSAESTSSIVFGSGNQVKGAAGFSAGAGNRVCDTYGVALGNNAKSGGPLINGKCDPDSFNIRGLAAVAIGYNVTADQDHTTAMGKFASNNGFTGTFVWSDGSATASADTFRNTANNEFALRATGGFRFRTNLAGTTGCNLPAGSGVFNCTSSRYTKENFAIVNGKDVLSRVRNMPISTWNYISEGRGVRHMGPMAEDFYQAFKLGTGNTSIGVQDLAGVSLGAIKELDSRTNELELKTAEVDQLRQQLNQLRIANELLEKRLTALEQNAKTGSVRQRHK
jgi:Chaperone of endosialidase/YadA head domain repeat (2 copies)